MTCKPHFPALQMASLMIALLGCTAHAAQLDWTPDQIKIEARKAEASFDAKGKLKIRTGAEESGSVTLRPQHTKSWDLSGCQAVELTLRNGGVTRIVPEVTLKSPNLIHNEIRFLKSHHIARIIQGRPANQPAKVEWIKRLAAKYGGIESLNKAWSTNYGSWDALLTSKNYQVGMLDITDTPYPELIRAVRKVGGEMYELRFRGSDQATR